jgi:adenylate kinase
LKTNPPKVEGVCDITGEELVQRDDDKEEVVRDRMKVFDDTMGPVISKYRNSGRLVEVDAAQDPQDVFDQILSKIN